MSILNIRPGSAVPPPPAAPYSPITKPKPAPIGPHQLGSTTLANVSTLTDMSADEIDKLADAVDTAAAETSGGLREVARRIRATGKLANEALADFVNVASTCIDVARHMQDAVDRRSEPQPAPAQERIADESATEDTPVAPSHPSAIAAAAIVDALEMKPDTIDQKNGSDQ